MATAKMVDGKVGPIEYEYALPWSAIVEAYFWRMTDARVKNRRIKLLSYHRRNHEWRFEITFVLPFLFRTLFRVKEARRADGRPDWALSDADAVRPFHLRRSLFRLTGQPRLAPHAH